MYLKQSTSTTIVLGPFLDDTDGKTAETALTIAQADVRLSKNAGTFAQKSDTGSCSHMEAGYYSCGFNTTDTNTLGHLRVAVAKSGALPVWRDYLILPANVYDSLLSTDKLQVHAVEITDDLITAAAIATDAVTELQTGLATAAALSAVAAYVDTEVAAILEDTGTTIPAQIAALNNLSAAQVNAEVDTALADYDAPTKAELDAGLAGLNDLDATEVQTAAAAALTAYDPPTKGELDTAVSGMSTLTAAQVWSYVTRELTSGGGGGATAQEVWEYATRELTGKSGFELTAAYDAAKSAAPVGAAMTLAANSVTAAALASDATAEIQSGLATSAEVADLPTNNELATALAAADDAVLAAIALLNNLSSAGAQAAAAAALAAYDAATGTDVTNATSPLATAAAVAALNNLSQAQAQAAATAALNAYDGPTKTEMDAAFTTADDAVLAAIAALNNTSATDFLTALQAMLVDGAITWMELQRVLLALIAGETTGGGTTDLAFLAQDGLTERIAATVDGSGNRTSVTLDGGA